MGIFFKGVSRGFSFLAVCSVFFQLGCASEKVSGGKRDYTRTEKAQLLIQIANGALVEGDPTGALHSLLKAEQEDAKLPDLHHSKALAYYAKHDLDTAIHCARKAVQLKNDYPDANNTLGKLLIDAGKYDEAVPFLKLAAQDPLYREAFKAWTNLGILSYRKGELQKSESYLNQAILDSPSNACIAYYYRGHIHLKKKNLKEAVSDYSEASKKLCAHFGDAHLALGMAYQQGQEFGLARKTFLEIQKRYPNTKLAEKAIDHLRFIP